MDADPQGARDDADLPLLRRRVYSPDATAADVQRYRAVLEASAQPEPGETVGGAPVTAPREPQGPADAAPRRRRAAAFVVAAVLLLGVIAGAAAWSGGARRTSAPSPSTTTDAVALAIPLAVQQAFRTRLQTGQPMGLEQYMFEHPQIRPPDLTTLTRAATEELSGVGGTTVSLDPPSDADAGGRMTVILTLGTDHAATWLAARVAVDRVQQVAMRTNAQGAGLPLSTTVRYAGRGATLLSVSVPRGTRWDAFVVFSD